MLMQILDGTPKWVFIIFFVLIWYGYLQSRSREAGKPRVLMLPIIMISLSVGGVLSSFGFGLPSMLSWLLGFGASIAINQVIQAPSGVYYNRETKRFYLPGSWIPLALMMVIYFAKYVVGATTALRPDIAGSTDFAVVLSAVFGIVSGAFFARFLRIWSHQSDAGGSRLGTAITNSSELEPST